MAATEAAETFVVIVEGVVGEEEVTLVVGEEVDSEVTEEEVVVAVVVGFEATEVVVGFEVTEEEAGFEVIEVEAGFEVIEVEVEAEVEEGVEGEGFPVAQWPMKFLRKMKLRMSCCYGLLNIPLEIPGSLIQRSQRLKMLCIQPRRRHSTLAA